MAMFLFAIALIKTNYFVIKAKQFFFITFSLPPARSPLVAALLQYFPENLSIAK